MSFGKPLFLWVGRLDMWGEWGGDRKERMFDGKTGKIDRKERKFDRKPKLFDRKHKKIS
ncbi:hypothetical protein [Cytobacillus gottheilii]|uniref:Uncharacterized protein n=1 Tax=Cytobacillus gottheilii TaxID=859144 RepID=A0ABX8FD35_9BACI|nr:hypothetical protein [Cytobacillus gottheilii]QVY61047.1 hypothetical protein J1899_19090 [Cytobacillus gottheilii]